LSFYVAEEIPVIEPLVRELAQLLVVDEFGAPLALPPDRFAEYSDFAQALADYEAEPRLRVIFESGAAAGQVAGAPQGAWETAFPAWPPAQTAVMRHYFHGDGTLRAEPPVAQPSASLYNHDPDEGQRLILADGGDIWALLPEWDWPQHAPGRAIVFESEPLAEDLVILGFSSVDLWIQSTADDADIEVTLSEVRPDGQEMYVQSGWLRASMRALAADASELRPTKTWREADVAALPSGQWSEARVELSAVGHAFRAGSRLRLSIDTPGASRAEWRFALKEMPSDTAISVAHSAAHPSSIALPVISDLAVPTPLPPCPSLRSQPCRAHQPYSNTPVPE
ncbi:MAG: CocE/NonD family hydrolase, partial [Myxococcota bacterium]